MLGGKGFLVIGYLFEKVSDIYIGGFCYWIVENY